MQTMSFFVIARPIIGHTRAHDKTSRHFPSRIKSLTEEVIQICYFTGEPGSRAMNHNSALPPRPSSPESDSSLLPDPPMQPALFDQQAADVTAGMG